MEKEMSLVLIRNLPDALNVKADVRLDENLSSKVDVGRVFLVVPGLVLLDLQATDSESTSLSQLYWVDGGDILLLYWDHATTKLEKQSSHSLDPSIKNSITETYQGYIENPKDNLIPIIQNF